MAETPIRTVGDLLRHIDRHVEKKLEEGLRDYEEQMQKRAQENMRAMEQMKNKPHIQAKMEQPLCAQRAKLIEVQLDALEEKLIRAEEVLQTADDTFVAKARDRLTVDQLEERINSVRERFVRLLTHVLALKRSVHSHL